MGSLSLQKLLSPKGLKKPPLSQGIIRQLVFFQGDDCVTGAHLLREENEALRDNALERSRSAPFLSRRTGLMSPCFQRYLIYMYISIGQILPRNRQEFPIIKNGIRDTWHWLEIFSSTPSSGDTNKSVCWTVGCHPYFHWQSVEGSLSLPAAVSDIFICLGRYLLYARLDGA